MKAITIYQPQASLVALGIKTIETRPSAPPDGVLGQRIAIHAGKRKPKVPANMLAALDGVGMTLEQVQLLPLGKVVATAVLYEAVQVESVVQRYRPAEPGNVTEFAVVRSADGERRELAVDPWGDYREGRWLWRLSDIQPVDPPVPARGKQGWWEWTPR